MQNHLEKISAELKASLEAAHPIKAAITLETTKGGPAIACLMARLLQDAGAKVTLPDGWKVPDQPITSLDGLEVDFVRTVWVVDREKMLRESKEWYQEVHGMLAAGASQEMHPDDWEAAAAEGTRLKIDDIREGLAILGQYAEDVMLDYVPRAFTNNTPDHPLQSQIYFVVTVERDVSDDDYKMLWALGWHPEQEGQHWCLSQLHANRRSAL